MDKRKLRTLPAINASVLCGKCASMLLVVHRPNRPHPLERVLYHETNGCEFSGAYFKLTATIMLQEAV